MNRIIRITLQSIAACIALTVAGLAVANAGSSYPADVVRVFVPASPGGSTDAVARVFAKHFENATGSSVAIVNQTGGGGIIAVQSVATGRPDGSALLLYHTALHVAHALERSPFQYDQLKPLATLSVVNEVYAVRGDAPFDTLEDLVSYAGSGAGKVTIGTEFGGTTQVKGQALAKTHKDFRVVDAGSESKRITSLLGGQVDVITMSVASAQQFEKSGDIKVLAVLNDDPDDFSPHWPTAASQGVDANLPQVFTVYGPKRMNASTVKKFDAVMANIAKDPAFIEAVKHIKQSPNYRDSATTSGFMEKEYSAIKKVVNQQ